MRAPQHTAGSDTANCPHQLHRRGCDRSLANADGDGFARVPLLLEEFYLPFFRRHDAGHFLRQINAGPLAKAEGGCIFRDAADAEPFGKRVEIRIARLVDCLVDVHRTVLAVLAEHPTFEETSVEGFTAAAVDL